jgi:lipopolysaccharide cholinephosphotransferase
MTQYENQPLSTEEIQACELDILQAFDRFCDKHSLTYWIAYGTLIGAIRHRGFIPWDDDADVIMPIEDYRRLIDLSNAGERIGSHYQFAAHTVEDAQPYHAVFGKIYDRRYCLTEFQLRERLGFHEGIYIDVLPLVGVPGEELGGRRMLRKIKRLNSLINLCTFKFGPSSTLISNVLRLASIIPARVAGYRYWLDRLTQITDRLPSHTATPTCFCPPYVSVIYPSEAFQESVKLEFAGAKFPAPKGWDELLRLDYGDYLQPPPPESRVSVHFFEAFRSDLSQ